MRLAHVTVLVKDQDQALAFYTEKLGFEKREDERDASFRWLTVAPPGQKDVTIALLKAQSEQFPQVGQGTLWVFYADDCRREYEALKGRGVRFRSAPADLPFGVSAIFEDPYGNAYNLLQPAHED
jgi:predicted enzyme related to lactoylglutathione lyase